MCNIFWLLRKSVPFGKSFVSDFTNFMLFLLYLPQAGPDGVMACLQGYLLRYLLYEQPTLDHVKRYAHSLRAALHFWRARRAARGRASERQCRLSLSRLLTRATQA